MKDKFIENGIEYVKCDDYYLPNFEVPQNQYEIGKYGRMRRKYLKEYCKRVLQRYIQLPCDVGKII